MGFDTDDDLDVDSSENDLFASGKGAAIRLYSHPTEVNSHRLRFLIQEKGIYANNITTQNYLPEEILQINPYGTFPVLVDRDLAVYEGNIMMEYLDERYPHPPLMPTDAVQRAVIRTNLHLIYTEWYSLVNTIERSRMTSKARLQSQKLLREQVMKTNNVLGENKYFMSDDFTLLDITAAPVFWRMKHLGIKIPRHASNFYKYLDNICSREAWNESLTEEEKVLNI